MPTVPGPKESDRVFTKENTPLMIPKPRPETKDEKNQLNLIHTTISLQIKSPRTREHYLLKEKGAQAVGRSSGKLAQKRQVLGRMMNRGEGEGGAGGGTDSEM